MRYLSTLILSLFAGGAVASETCVFTTECFEGDGCYDTSFEMTIENGQLITDAETIEITAGAADADVVFVGYTASAIHVLTREKQGAARYSTHIFDGILMVNYLGTCE